MPFELIMILLAVLGAIVGYLIGSISFAVIFTRVFKNIDVREHGSGNAGMTNVMRTAGALPGILTLLCDFLKAVLAVCLGRYVLIPIMQGFAPNEAIRLAIDPVYGAFLCGISCFIGHIFPLYFSFKGGKGVLTGIGMILFIDWRIFLIVLGAFLIVFAITKIVSLSSLIGAVVFPIATFLLYPYTHSGETVLFGLSSRIIETIFAAIIGGIVIFKHKENIKRLLKGEEKPITKKVK